MQTEFLGDIQSIEQQLGKLVIKTANTEAHVYIYSPTIIRVNITKEPEKEDQSFAVIEQPLGDIKYRELSNSFEISTSALKLSINKSPLRFSFYTANGKLLNADEERFGTTWRGSQVISYRKLFPNERFIGLGEKVGNLDRRASSYVNWNTDAAEHGIDTDPLYKTFPFYIGIHSGLMYGLFMDNTHKSYFDFGATTDNEMSWFGADGGDMNYYLFGAQSVGQILEDYTWLTGRMEMPPLWSLGYQQCRWSYMSADEVLEIAQTFREKKIPADVMYCDIDYMDAYKIFTWDPKTFPKPKQLLDKLKAMDFHLVTIVDPGIKVEKGYKQYDEGIKKDYFAIYPNGDKFIGEVWPGRCHFPDFFREDVREWWGAAFKALTDPGVDGFWNDMNEPAAWGQNISSLMQFGDQPMPEVRNAYGMQMARATYDGTKKILKGKRPFVLTRAAYCGTQRYSAVWTGDNSAYDSHMLLGQRLVNSLGLTGMAFTGVDIGGFSGDPTPELMVRWNSLGTYTPMFRNHARLDTAYREPWRWGAKNEAIIKKDIEQRYQLLPYIYSSFYTVSQTGLPLSRTLAIEHTFDDNIYKTKYQNQFLFGDSLLVAPVISTEKKADVYLPKGEWYRLSSDKQFDGEQVVTVPAPLNDLPVFVKASAIIPMQSIVQSTAEKGDGILQLHIWNGTETNEFIYYEDDGSTYDYQKGKFYKRVIRFYPTQKQVILDIPEGTFNSKFIQINLMLHSFDNVNSLMVNDSEVKLNTRSAKTSSFVFNNTNNLININY